MKTFIIILSLFFAMPLAAQTTPKPSLVITEIMPDPAPIVRLPDWEFIEIYNASSEQINLKDWSLMIGDKSYSLTKAESIDAGEFLLLTHKDAVAEMETFGRVFAALTSKTALTNTGARLRLSNPEGQIVDDVKYSDTWYTDNIKKEGGWSLERVDYTCACASVENWKPSKNVDGGTPGKLNSVSDKLIFPDPAEVFFVSVPTDSTLEVHFLRGIHTFDPEAFIIKSQKTNTDYPLAVQSVESYSILFSSEHKFDPTDTYTCFSQQPMTDCAGWNIEPWQAAFALPQKAESQDIVINEFLSNPSQDNVAFVELFNRSNKAISLAQIRIGTAEDRNNVIAENARIFMPGEYIVITKDIRKLRNYYGLNALPLRQFVEMPNLHTLNKNDGSIYLLEIGLELIDFVNYNEKMHAPLLINTENVSLERVNPDVPSNAPANWQSSAVQIYYASPCKQNSVFFDPDFSLTAPQVAIPEKVFSPNGDGYQDFLQIEYAFAEENVMADVRIFNSAGQLVKTLLQNEKLAKQGYLIWDGRTDDNNLANVGIYLISFNVRDYVSLKKHFRLSCVIADRRP